MYRKRRRYYRKSEPAILDMLIESIVKLVILMGKLIWKIFSAGIKKYRERKVLNVSSNDPVNIHTGESDERVARLRKEEVEEQKYDLQTSLLTPTEENFYEVLKKVVDNRYQIIPQVQLSKIMKVRDSDYGYTNYHDFNKINKKSIDFVLYDENLKAHLAIELDDYSHSRPNRIRRDEFVDKIMEEAGLRILHVPVADYYDLEELKSRIFYT